MMGTVLAQVSKSNTIPVPTVPAGLPIPVLHPKDDTSTELEYDASDSEDEELDEPTSDDDYEPGRQKSHAGPKKVVRFLREHPQYATHTVNICTVPATTS